MIRASNGSFARSRPQKEHGRHIFAYCHATTNQVLYSLTRVLQGNRALKQLPDAGANNNPPKLRKDHWRPLWTLTLPEGENGLAQGLNAFKKLRELRKLHELHWDPPPELARPATEEHIEAIKKRLDDRGGKKAATPYDVLKKEKKKIRQRMVMDQKANSVADLAAVLTTQEKVGVAVDEQKDALQTTARGKEVAEMLRLAQEAKDGGIEKLDDRIEKMQLRIQAKKAGTTAEDKSNRRLRKDVHILEKRKRNMLFSARAVEAANRGTTWIQDRGTTALEADKALWAQVRHLQQEIRSKRDTLVDDVAEPLAPNNSEQPEQNLLDEEAALDKLEEASVSSSTFKHSPEDQLLELELIRRKVGRPDAIAKALGAYAAKQPDIDQLSGLAAHWNAMLHKLADRYRARAANLQDMWNAIRHSDDALKEFVESRKLEMYLDPDTGRATNQSVQMIHEGNRTGRKARSRRAVAISSLLEDVLAMDAEAETVDAKTDPAGKVKALKALIRKHRLTNLQRTVKIVLRAGERGARDKLAVLDADRLYATLLAKAKVEARVAELEAELKQAEVAGQVRNESDEAFEEEEGVEEVGEEGVEARTEELAQPPSQDAVREAVKQVRRLSARLRDVDNISQYRDAVERLKRDGLLNQELKPEWVNLEAAEKLSRYEAYVTELECGEPALQRARQLASETDGLERLYKAAESARERSMAARDAGGESEMLQQKFAAKTYERVARLRENEDVVLEAEERRAVGQEASSEDAPGDTSGTATSTDASVGAERSVPETNGEARAKGDAEPAGSEVDYYALLPSFPEKTTLPSNAEKRKALKDMRKPVYTTAGVRVQWADVFDAEYAETWPENVRHEPMGLTRHTAPAPEKEPVHFVDEFKQQPGGGYTGKKYERTKEKKAVRGEAGGIAEKILEGARVEAERRAVEAVAKETAQREEEARLREAARQRIREKLGEEKGSDEVGRKERLARLREEMQTIREAAATASAEAPA